ncbi:MAG: hypothetical protein OXD36_17985 [Rhodobacter sp.]|nr:hypothetical protein [Rhodobacter sp.]
MKRLTLTLAAGLAAMAMAAPAVAQDIQTAEDGLPAMRANSGTASVSSERRPWPCS